MEYRRLRCVEIANGHPNRLNFDGKKFLCADIFEELSEREINEFLRVWGYDREPQEKVIEVEEAVEEVIEPEKMEQPKELLILLT